MAIPETPAQIVVCDAGPLIHLDELGCIDLLNDFPTVLVPTIVWSEVDRHRSKALTNPATSFVRVSTSESPAADLSPVARLFALHSGEAQALQLCKEKSANLLLTDDTAARLAARSIGIAVHGTIGLLVRSIRRGKRTSEQVVALLKAIPIASTLHIKRSLLDEVIQLVERSL
jgi:predicted nucleic acid-binding protein